MLLFLIFFTACNTKNIASKTGILKIHYGDGGGFTGEVTTYTLKANGDILKEKNELKKISTKKTRQIFEEAAKLKDYKKQKPGNIYSFIELKGKDLSNEIVWSPGTKNIDPKVTKLYKKLTSLTKTDSE